MIKEKILDFYFTKMLGKWKIRKCYFLYKHHSKNEYKKEKRSLDIEFKYYERKGLEKFLVFS